MQERMQRLFGRKRHEKTNAVSICQQITCTLQSQGTTTFLLISHLGNHYCHGFCNSKLGQSYSRQTNYQRVLGGGVLRGGWENHFYVDKRNPRIEITIEGVNQ